MFPGSAGSGLLLRWGTPGLLLRINVAKCGEEKRSPRALHAQSLNPDIFVSRKAWKMPGKTTALVPKCISDKKFIIGAIVLVVVLIIIIISLAVKETKSCPIGVSCESVACPDSWITYRGKYFYVSKEKRTWSMSLKTCSSFNASLAVIDTQKELDIFVDNLGLFHFWFGLSRKDNQHWKWPNGTEFKNRFPVGGEGFCAYVNGKGADSTVCSLEKRFLCSHPQSCIR
ncbi:C-type lectin domain family 2 member D [Protobothrops mucrosquamatus]|uniref:C-type lectin domain family 2 member D n=1 Tax=Protobothrops mucrosquamatus TaxID=103944 RepID=UPI000775609E|nr:C-type lectin domain family 2 member D [Protobothrops mucrosquamatus]